MNKKLLILLGATLLGYALYTTMKKEETKTTEKEPAPETGGVKPIKQPDLENVEIVAVTDDVLKGFSSESTLVEKQSLVRNGLVTQSTFR